MLIYKKDDKENWLKAFVLSISLLLCYNIVICVILSFVKINCTLPTLSIINIILSIILGLKIFKDKKTQKYYINKMDIIALISIFILVTIISIMQYGIQLSIKHTTTDASTHYLGANEFYHYSKLLFEENSDLLGTWKEDFLMPGAYINTGLLFKIFSPIIEETYFCKLYELFDIGMWCLSGLLMYVVLANNKKQGKQKTLPLIFSIIYMIGYPLHSLISGFSYLQVGLNTIITMILIMHLDDKTYYKNILIFMASFALMFSYYYFAPVVFLAVFIQMILEIKKENEKLFSSKNIVKILFSLVIPGIFGVMYFIIFQILINGKNLIQEYTRGINLPGPIYDNLITTILIFALLSIYDTIKNIKQKKQNFTHTILIICAIFVMIAFVGMQLQKVSEYYYYKLYYMLWIYIIVVAFNAINILKDKKKILTYTGIALYCIGVIVAIIFNKNILLFDIYCENFNEVKSEYQIISDKELEIFEYYNKNIDTADNWDDTTYWYVGGNGRPRWAYVLTKNPYIFIDVFWCDPLVDIQQFFDSDKNKCVIFKLDNEDIYNNIENVENIKILFKNEAGVIVEKN